ncbi:MAG: OmpA family protein [Bacteroidetes bacterium]|nr:OmpA family protein [Bacteroidota bacterium]
MIRSVFLFIPFTFLFVTTNILAQTMEEGPVAGATFDSTWVWEETEIYFDFGESRIRPEGDSLLTDLQQAFVHRPEADYLIQAHTDAIGTDGANLRLSANRANAVAERLLQLGVDSSQIRLETFGESRPQAENDTDEGRQYNRRATVRVQEKRKMFWMSGEVVDKDTGEGIPAEIVIRSREHLDSASTDTTGKYLIPVPDNTVIGIETFAPGYFFHSEMFKARAIQPPSLRVELPPIKPGEVVALHHFYFVGNQDTLLPRSEPELYRLRRFMEINPGISIEIAGHINLPNNPPVALTSWNYNLSVRRARRIYNYLIEEGVERERLAYIGFGNWNMRFPHARTQQEQELNRRVEIRIPGEGEVISSQDTIIPDEKFLQRRLEQWKQE